MTSNMLPFFAVIVLCFASTTLAQVSGWGRCPQINAVSDFDISKSAGTWYEARRYFTSFEAGMKCVKAVVTAGEDGNMLLDGSGIYKMSGHLGETKNITVRVADPSEPGKLIWKLPSSNIWNNLWVLGTDYDSYIVGYNCIDAVVAHKKYLWILTRDQQASDDVINKATDIVQNQKLDKDVLSTTEQSDCQVKP